MASATITGGNTVTYNLSGNEAVIAKNALANLSSQYSTSKVLTSPVLVPSPLPTNLDVYNYDSKLYSSVTAAAGTEAIVMKGNTGTNIVGNAGIKFIAGSGGNDTINAGGGNVTIAGGAGNDLIQLANTGSAGGSAYITLATGNDTVRLWGGDANIVNATVGDRVEINSGNNNVTVSGQANYAISGGTNQISAAGGNYSVSGGNTTLSVTDKTATISKTGGSLDVTLQTIGNVAGSYTLNGDMTVRQTASGNYSLSLNGNDTVYLGAGNDTINVAGAGSSTLYGGSGKLNYTGGTGADSITAGSGAATILGGGGIDTIIGGSGLLKADGGFGGDLLIGGSFKDTLTGGSGGDMFRFVSSAAGGQHIITDFTHGQDKIDLTGGGYTLADISSTTVKSGSTIIKLHDGTQITLKNFTGINTSDFA